MAFHTDFLATLLRCYPVKKNAGWEFLKELQRIGHKHVGVLLAYVKIIYSKLSSKNNDQRFKI